MARPILWLAIALLAACATLPDVPVPAQGLSAQEDYPPFLPLEEIAFERVAAAERTEETETDVQRRVASLKARAAQLRARPVE